MAFFTEKEKKERKRACDRRHRLIHREEKIAYLKQYRENNREKVREGQKKYSEANKEKIKIRRSKWYAKNKKKVLAKLKKKRQEKPELYRNRGIGFRERLPDSYVRAVLSINLSMNGIDIPPELIKIKREQLKLYRLIKEGIAK